MKLYLFLINALLFASFKLSAQSAIHYPDEMLDSSRMIGMNSKQMHSNANYAGMAMPPFTALTTSGKIINNTTIKGSVYLFVLWYTDCSCYDVAHLNRLDSIKARHKDFHVVSLLPDTAYLSLYQQRHTQPFEWAIVTSPDEVAALNFHNGYPAYLLVNRAGVIVKIFSPFEIHDMDDTTYTEFARYIEQLLML